MNVDHAAVLICLTLLSNVKMTQKIWKMVLLAVQNMQMLVVSMQITTKRELVQIDPMNLFIQRAVLHLCFMKMAKMIIQLIVATKVISLHANKRATLTTVMLEK